MEKVSKSYAMLHAKCPRCRQGDMFANSMYGFKAQKMHERCPKCDLRYEREPGYFYVAMFISYAMNVAEMITIAVATFVFTGESESPMIYLGVILAAVFLLSPFNLRYSRVMLLHWLTPNIQYKEENQIKL